MAKQNYNECLNRLLKDEGGYTNHPDDKGGPTNFGITIADYRRYIKPGATIEDVKAMKLDEAKVIYRKRYWDAIDADNLPSGIDYCLFDYGVNSGVGRVRMIKKKFESIKDPVKYINAVCNERLEFMHNIRGGKDWSVFGRGWASRVAGVRTRSVQLAQTSTPENTTATLPVVGGFAALYQFGLAHWPEILVCTVLLSVAGYYIVKWYNTRKALKNV